MSYPYGWADQLASSEQARAGSSSPTFANMVGGLWADRYSKGDEKHGSWHFNHDYPSGTALFPHVHFSPDDTAIGNVRWGIELSYARGYGLDAFGATTTYLIDYTTTGVALAHFIAETPEPGIDIPTAETDGVIRWRFFRANTAADTYSGRCFVTFIDLHTMTDHRTTTNRNRGSGWVKLEPGHFG